MLVWCHSMALRIQITFGSCMWWPITKSANSSLEPMTTLTKCRLWSSVPIDPGKFEWNFRYVIFKRILVIDGWDISCEIALMWMSLDLTNDQSTLIHVMVWCGQAPSHYLSHCWPRSLSPYGVTRQQWDNYMISGTFSIHCVSNKAHVSLYTTAQKFPFKMAKQACNMIPNLISKSCT